MLKKLPFDTLELATLLKKGGVEKYEIHAASLAAVITQNIYVKNEVDKMIEAALAKFDMSIKEIEKSRKESDDRVAASMNEFRLTLELTNAHIEKRFNHNLYATITVLGALIALANTATALVHYFVR